MNALNLFNIYEKSIEDIYDTCTSALEEYEINIDFEEEVIRDLEEIGDWNDIGNSIIHAMLSTTKAFLNNKGIEDVDYYVNGLDSHLHINGEEYFG